MQGSGQYAESMCQTLMDMDELLDILSDPRIRFDHKIPFANFLTFGYMTSSRPAIQTGAIELPHKK